MWNDYEITENEFRLWRRRFGVIKWAHAWVDYALLGNIISAWFWIVYVLIFDRKKKSKQKKLLQPNKRTTTKTGTPRSVSLCMICSRRRWRQQRQHDKILWMEFIHIFSKREQFNKPCALQKVNDQQEQLLFLLIRFIRAKINMKLRQDNQIHKFVLFLSKYEQTMTGKRNEKRNSVKWGCRPVAYRSTYHAIKSHWNCCRLATDKIISFDWFKSGNSRLFHWVR